MRTCLHPHKTEGVHQTAITNFIFTNPIMAKMNHDKRHVQSKNALSEPRAVTITLCSILVALNSLPKHMSVRAQAESAFPIGKRDDKVQLLAEVFVSKGAETNDANDTEERLLRRNRGRKKGTHHIGANRRKKQARVVKRKKRTARKKRYGGTYKTGGKPSWGGNVSWQAPPTWGGNGSWQAPPAWGGTEAPPAWGGGSVGLYGTCGGGSIGNGLCPNINECCSEYGFCGTSVEYCTNKGNPGPPTPPPSGKPIWSGGWVNPSPPHTIKCGEWGSSFNQWGGGYDPCIAMHAPTGNCAQCDMLSFMNELLFNWGFFLSFASSSNLIAFLSLSNTIHNRIPNLHPRANTTTDYSRGNILSDICNWPAYAINNNHRTNNHRTNNHRTNNHRANCIIYV